MDEGELRRRFEEGTPWRQDGPANDASPSKHHDQAILSAAREAAGRIRRRRALGPAGWSFAFAAAASFALGIGIGLLAQRWPTPEPTQLADRAPLTVPAQVATRGQRSTGAAVPVEQVDAGVWYRYIQELVYAGDRAQAERHLRRFNQLHPDFRYQP
jgi:hypothetical protein